MQRKLKWFKNYLKNWGNSLASALIVSLILTSSLIILDSMIRTKPPSMARGYTFLAPIRYEMIPLIFFGFLAVSFVPTIFLAQLEKSKFWLNIYVFCAMLISFFSFLLFWVIRKYGAI